eukprot:TRINITY_DN5332_c0_g3_i1.p1 TRINITY_DN5332_c0_g3~~TRINITY_DN5332_c0_g3_i1.p1  ORF type:complete len:427 (+),score=70.98 TRINITY_DN5332_c0_g3_i1:156-1436(+)
MGLSSCETSAKSGVSDMEPELTLFQFNEDSKLSAYQLIASRLLPAKKEFLSSFYEDSPPAIKNYDPYYQVLSSQITPSFIPNCPASHNSKARNSQSTKKRSLKITTESSSPPSFGLLLKSVAQKNAPNLRSRTYYLKKNITQMKSCGKKCQFDLISLLPASVVVLIFSFVVDEYRSCLLVSASWYLALLDSLDVAFNKIETKFAQKYVSHAMFRNSYTNFLKQDKSSMRIVRVLQFELLGSLGNKTLTVGYTCKYANDRGTRYGTTYKIDCKERGRISQWIHRAVNEHGKSVLTYGQNIVPVRAGDVFEIAINYYTLRGLIDIDTVECIKPVVEPTPSHSELFKAAKSYDSFIVLQNDATKLRVCEIEQLKGGEWCEASSSWLAECEMKELLECFSVESKECSRIDSSMQKIALKAVREGIWTFNG